MGPRSDETNTPQHSVGHEMDDTDNRNGNNATTGEDEPEMTDTADVWAVGEGYTPLTDFTNSNGISGRNPYVMVSTGPRDFSDSDDSDNNDNNNNSNNDDWQEASARPGSFHVNQNVFGNLNDMDVSPAVNSSVEDNNFDEIATSALSALDKEYQQTLVRSHGLSSNEQQEDEDLKTIAAGFDQRQEELQRIRNEGGFVAKWEEAEGKSSTIGTLKNDQEQQREQKKDHDVDTDAVRRAIETLSVKNKDAPFQKKFAIWQQHQLPKQQQKQNDPHKLIPMSSYMVFHEPKPTAKSRLTSANLSRSATLAEAVVRLSLLSSFQGDLLLIDIVGVDRVECDSTSTIRNTFRPFVRWLDDYILASQRDRKIHVHFRLIGRELFTTAAPDAPVVDLLHSSPTQSSSLRATATCHSGVYHTFLEETCRAGAESNEHGNFNCLSAKKIPDLAVAFNAGIWGYREWAETIQYLALLQHGTTTIPAVEAGPKNSARCGIPMIITAYTLDECQEDQEVISQSITSTGEGSENTAKSYDRYQFEILWESERNPFGSQVIRETKGSTQEYRENAYWQAWLLGGKPSGSS